MIGGNLGAVQGSDGCWSIPWWCGDTVISQMFPSCNVPTPSQLGDSRCNAGRNLDPSITNQLNPRSSFDLAASGDQSGADNYSAYVNHPLAASMIGSTATNLLLGDGTSLPWGLIALGVVGVLVITR